MPAKVQRQECGIVMPISAIDGCSADHWKEVLGIFREAIEAAGFQPNLVSDADDVGVIQKRIIQNLYTNPIVVCDVSGKNPNVMFELGMRLAFDKPTLIVKDDATEYTFDTSPVEHLNYPRDLRYQLIQSFKITLTDKIRATYQNASEDPEYSTFLKHLGFYTAATKLDEEELPVFNYLLTEIQELRYEVKQIAKRGSGREDGPNPGLSSLDAVPLLESAYAQLLPSTFAESHEMGLSGKRLQIAELLCSMLAERKTPVPLSMVMEFVNQRLG